MKDEVQSNIYTTLEVAAITGQSRRRVQEKAKGGYYENVYKVYGKTYIRDKRIDDLVKKKNDINFNYKEITYYGSI